MSGKQTHRHTPAAGARSSSGGSGPPWVLIGGLAAVAVVAAVVLYPGMESDPTEASAPADAQDAMARPVVEHRPSSPRPPADAPLPSLPLVPDLIPRSPEVITEAYTFAARNPDILEYVPCFCGCESAGHTGNASCFVQSRNPDGTVREWDTHGMSCIVCVDVARTAQQLYASGATARDIRAAVEAQYAGSPRMTPTPAPPAE